MRILLVNNLYPPHSRGGAETAVVNEAQALLAAGHEVAVFTTAPFSGWRSLKVTEWKEDGVSIFRFFPLNWFWYRNDSKHGAFVRALWYIGNLWGGHPVGAFKKVARNFKPDVVHLHNINGISYRLPKVCDRLKLKTVFTVHAVHYAFPSGVILRQQKVPFAFKIFAAILRRKLRSKATVTAPSRWLLDYYLGQGFFKGQPTAVVANPLSPAPVLNTARAPRDANGTASEAKQSLARFLYVGQLEPYKGLNVMLAALKRLPAEMPWRLEIVGAGPMMDNLRRERDSRVLIRGRLQGEELASAFLNATALIVPSLCEENSPMVVAEACSYSLPAIASRIGGIPEMVSDGESGLLFDPGNADELALECRRVIEHPEILLPMRQKCAELAKLYAPARIAAEYLKLFQK